MRVLFVSIGSYGLVLPALGAAVELARQGHTPVFLTHQRGADLVEQAGFSCVSKVTGTSGLNIEGWWTPVQAYPQFQLVERAIRKARPDVIVTDHFATGAIIAGRAFEVPVAVLGPVAYLYPVADCPADSAAAKIRGARYATIMDGYQQTAQLLGLPPTDDDSPFLGDRYLLRSVPSFEVYAAALPERVRFAGACLYDVPRHDDALAAWIESDVEGRPVALMQIEKLFDFNDPIQAILALCEERGIRVAAALGPGFTKYRTFATASAYIGDHLPQRQILERSRFVISTGQPTAVLGAICAGLPTLILDYGSGAAELLHCCATAGNGAGLPGNTADADSLAPLLDRMISDDAMRSNALRVQQAFAEVDSFAVIAEILDELVRSHARGGRRRRTSPERVAQSRQGRASASAAPRRTGTGVKR